MSGDWNIARVWGESAVQALRRKMFAQGYGLVRLDAIGTKGAPSLESQDGKVVLPDMMHTHPLKGAGFTEVKFKSHNDIYQKGGIKSPSNDATWRQWQQGVDLHHWLHYLKIQEQFGIPGYISIIVYRPGHEAEPNPHHLYQSLDQLSRHIQYCYTNPKFKYGAALFPLGIWRCSPITEYEIPGVPSLVRSLNVWEQKAKDGTAPAWLIEYRDVAPLEGKFTAPTRVDHCCVCDAPFDIISSVRAVLADGTVKCSVCANKI